MPAKAIYAAMVLLALLAIPFKPFDSYFLIKALPILYLAARAYLDFKGGARFWLCAALGLSALGDILLALEFKLQFVLGLSAFLLAQLAYGLLYIGQLDRARLWRVAIAAIFPIAALSLLIPMVGDMAIAVSAYTLAIGFMLLAAWGHKSPSLLIALGASCFILSDSFIGFNKFVAAIPASDYWVMISYYLAQWLMFAGLRRYWRPS